MLQRYLLALFCLIWPFETSAQDFSGAARAIPQGTQITSKSVSLALSQGVPFRLFTLDGPPRIIVDFAEVDFSDLVKAEVLPQTGTVQDVRFGRFQPRWSRMVLDLAKTASPQDIAMTVDNASGAAVLSFDLAPTDAQTFLARSGAPSGWGPTITAGSTANVNKDKEFIVVLDPGHGGIDPGAERGGLVEKELALNVSRRIRDELRRAGVRVEVARDDDVFVSLEARTATAHRAGGALFMSLHADALSQGGAQGATLYTLSQEASDVASARLAERHNRSDILAGVDLKGTDDEVTSVLLDLARRETEPRTNALAEKVIASMDAAGGPMNRKPWRRAGFSVLKSADIPSVLVELGFLSSKRDQKNLGDPAWQAKMAKALAQAILEWRDEDAARRQLLRQ